MSGTMTTQKKSDESKLAPSEEEIALKRKQTMKKIGIFLFKLFFLVYAFPYIWKSMKNVCVVIWQLVFNAGNMEQNAASMVQGVDDYYPCKKCGMRIHHDVKICPYCGDKVVSGSLGKALVALFCLPYNLAVALVMAAPTLGVLYLLSLIAGNK